MLSLEKMTVLFSNLLTYLSNIDRQIRPYGGENL